MLGKGMELNDKQIAGVFKRFQKLKPIALNWIDHSFLTKEYQDKYKILLESRYKTIYE